jgi:hypothetical protein
VVIEEKVDLQSEFSDAEYWKTEGENAEDIDYDALIAELEG